MSSSFFRVVDRARAEFVEMPGLEVTLPQAARLWNLSVDECRRVIDVLTDAGFLRWTAGRTVVRTGRDLVLSYEPAPADISVASPQDSDTSVWSE